MELNTSELHIGTIDHDLPHLLELRVCWSGTFYGTKLNYTLELQASELQASELQASELRASELIWKLRNRQLDFNFGNDITSIFICD